MLSCGLLFFVSIELLTVESLYNDTVCKILDANSAVDVGLYEEKTYKNGKSRMIYFLWEALNRCFVQTTN